jgi:hypothetical protein
MSACRLFDQEKLVSHKHRYSTNVINHSGFSSSITLWSLDPRLGISGHDSSEFVGFQVECPIFG